MFWEEMTSGRFEKALNEAEGTCIFPFGVIEKHGSHLPLCTDMLIAGKVAGEAAKLTPVLVYPCYSFGQINEARHTPGTVSLRPDLEYSLLSAVFDEIARNGVKKIVILSSHGGNNALISYFMQGCLHGEKNYLLYNIDHQFWYTDAQKSEIMKLLGLDGFGDHAGAIETSYIMAIRPDLVHMDEADPEGPVVRGRLKHLGNISTPVSWYADHPSHQMGNPASASADAGSRLISYAAGNVAEMVRLIKDDSVAGELQNEFFGKCKR